jgi:2-dehydro-3-deoxy-D-arabinonate dehydratase
MGMAAPCPYKKGLFMQDSFLIAYQENGQTKLGLQLGESIYSLDSQKIPSFEWLLQNVAAGDLLATLDAAKGELVSSAPSSLKGLLSHQPIWAAGVTYKTSEEARERESNNSTVYTRVYSAARPELFWKSIGYLTVSQGDKVGIRDDASWSVPEPELTMVINSRNELFGFTIGNDMSSRDIEGENPLYLPQAKVYRDSCALGPRIWLQPQLASWPEIEIEIAILRGGAQVFVGKTSTARLKRELPELLAYLGRCMDFPYGVFLMTGTGVVPADDFTLLEGDIVQIRIEPIGELVNTVHIVGNR